MKTNILAVKNKATDANSPPKHNWVSDENSPYWCDSLYPVASWDGIAFTIYIAQRSNFLISTEIEYAISINLKEPNQWYPKEPQKIHCTATGVQFYLGDILHQIPWPQQHHT